MSTVAKALIAINAFLALVFLGAASALVYRSGDYKEKYDQEVAGRRQDNSTSEKRISDLGANIKTYQGEIDQLRNENGRNRSDADANRNAYEQEQKVNAQLRGAVDDIKTNLDNFRQTIQDLNSQLDGMTKEKDRMRDARDAAVSSQEKAERERNDSILEMTKLRQELEDLKTGATQAMDERNSLDAKLKVMQARTGVGAEAVMAQPLIEGRIVDVASDIGLIALNVGKAQGVKVGYSFDIYKDGRYKGKAVVDSVQDNYSSAKITLKVPGTTIEKDDSATTRL